MATRKSKIPVLAECRAHVYYSGRVQGVGFRYTAERMALELHLVGAVRNLPDGRVEIICEGSRQSAEQLLKCIAESNLAPHIKKTQCVWETPTNQYTDFSIEFCH